MPASSREHLVIQLQHKSVWCWLAGAWSVRPRASVSRLLADRSAGSASYLRTRIGSYSVCKCNYSKNCVRSFHLTPQTKFIIKYWTSEIWSSDGGVCDVLWHVMSWKKNSWILHQITAGVHIFSKNLALTSKFQTPEGSEELQILSVTVHNSVHTTTWRPGLCTPCYTTSRHISLSSTHVFV